MGIAEGQYTVGMESLAEQGSLTVGEFSGQSYRAKDRLPLGEKGTAIA